MSSVLAIDSSGFSCSAALAVDGEMSQRVELAQREHAQKLLPMVDRLLVEAGIQLKDIDALAYSKGPGSFTGLRIGFGIVQGLAYGIKVPVIGISTLEVMACRAAQIYSLPMGSTILPAVDARMGQIYWGLFFLDEKGGLRQAVPDSLSAPAELHGLIPSTISLGVGNGWDILPQSLAKIVEPSMEADAMTLVKLALPLFNKGQYQNIEDSELCYLRNEIGWKKHSKIRR